MTSNDRLSGRPTVAEKRVSAYLYEFLKSYLYLLSIGHHSGSEVEVVGLAGYSASSVRRPRPVSVTDDLDGQFLRVADPILSATLRFRAAKYHGSMFDLAEGPNQIGYYLHVVGDGESSGDAQVLLDELVKDCIKGCPYQNQLLLASSEGNGGQMVELERLVLPDDHMDSIFLPAGIRRQLDLFISAVIEFDRVRIPLRYLLAGRPGTGKTMMVRAIASACRGKATFLFAHGGEPLVAELFDLASMFSPVVICIDDIDMLTGSRRSGAPNRQLAAFLQRLDGFAPSGLFMLATTNDKALIDLAASRPGRFDRILDVSVIEPAHYLSLVRSKSENPKVIEQFDGEILTLLARKRVSGAFIANLAKHLDLTSRFEPARLTREYVRESIEGAYDGFYRDHQGDRAEVGFRPV